MVEKRVLITVGGTGGHVFPAMALAEQLKRADPDIYILFVGEGLASNDWFDRQQFPYQEVSSGTFPLKRPIQSFKSFGRIGRGVWQSRRILKEFTPDLVVGFGSFHSLPVLLASKMLGVPFFLHESNTIAGKVNRLLARHAVGTGVQFPQVADHLKGTVFPVALPIRSHQKVSKAQARQFFNLDPNAKTLLVFGGSQGAHALNNLIVEAFTCYHSNPRQLQVIHLTGSKEQSLKARAGYAAAGVVAAVKDFESNMEAAWGAADLLVSRAGAGTIAEMVEHEVPGILVPYPYAADRHQDSNADFVAERVGGALKIDEGVLTPYGLLQQIQSLLSDGQRKLNEMRQAIRYYKSNSGSQQLCSVVCEFLNRDTVKERG